jgi:EAL domain-containing protein (putative c-di-GMP-specific phosphodiesterase class I)
LLRDRYPLSLARLTNRETIFAGAALFVVLLAIANHAIVHLLANRYGRRIASVGAFEAELRKKLLDVESQIAGLTAAAEDTQADVARLMQEHLREEARKLAEETKEEPPPPLDENIIQFDKTGRARPAGGPAAKEPEGELEIWFQPVVTLPGRKTRFFDSIAHIVPAGGTGTPAGRSVTDLADTAETALGESLRFARELDRKERSGGVIWHINNAILSDLAAHRRVRSALAANSRLSDRLVIAIAHKAHARLNRAAAERLFAFKEMGYRIAICDLPDADTAKAVLKNGLFALVIGPADHLLTIGATGTGAATGMVRFSEYGCEALAYDVEHEDVAMALIDHDILLAMGNLFSAARPLRRNARAQAGAGS